MEKVKLYVEKIKVLILAHMPYIRGLVKNLIFIAEKKAKEYLLEDGQAKKDFVVDKISEKLPKFFTKELIGAIVQFIYDKIIESL